MDTEQPASPEQPSTPSAEIEARLQMAVEAFLEELQRGQRPDRAHAVAAEPELAPWLDDCGSSFRVEPGMTATYRSTGPAGTIGRFQVLELLGRGAFGEVYKARDSELDRFVALKLPRADYFASSEDARRFLREARSAAGLRHPSIVQVHEIAHERGSPYIVSDYIDGLTLADLISSGRPGFRESAELVAQLADALDYAHRQKVIHRDIKPSNILLATTPDKSAGGSQFAAYLTDFGLARREETCFGAPRRLILDHLEQRYGRRFNTVWSFVRFAQAERLGLDFSTPQHASCPPRPRQGGLPPPRVATLGDRGLWNRPEDRTLKLSRAALGLAAGLLLVPAFLGMLVLHANRRVTAQETTLPRLAYWSETMIESDDLRYTKMALNNGSGAIPALGFGTLIPDPVVTRTATKAALETGFRQLDASERYRNEKEVGEAIQEVFQAGKIKREEVFIATKLWNNNHRPERVKPAFEASLKRLQLDYVDLYLIHTPFAFQPGDEQDPRDANGNVIYDEGITLLETWRALEGLVDEGRCKAIGLSDISLDRTKEIVEAGRIKPAVVHVESHPYLPQWELLNYCRTKGIVLQAFAALGHSSEPKLLEDPVITAIARRVNKTPAQVLLAWAIQRGTALLTTSKTPSRIKENFEVSTLPQDAMREISEGIKSRVRFNAVVETGVPGFIPRGKGG